MRTHVVNYGKNIYGENAGWDRLEQYDLDRVESFGIDEIWYCYSIGSYEGYGHLLARIEDRYELFDLSHCSCYGPTEQDFGFKGSSLSDLWSRCSEYLQEQVIELFKAAGMNC